MKNGRKTILCFLLVLCLTAALFPVSAFAAVALPDPDVLVAKVQALLRRAYDYGARSKRRWSPKHDNILWYAKDPERYVFNYGDIDRIPYMAPSLAGPEKAARGKTPTDVWWHTIVSPNGREKTGYATQKPRGVVDRIVKTHSRKGDLLMDFFAGSGTLGESARAFGRDCILVDDNPAAIETMKRRFAGLGNVTWEKA